jgi:hypothetical protein
MDAKFGYEWGGWRSIDTSRPHGVGLWKSISRGWRLFSSHTRFDLGDGFKATWGGTLEVY